MPMLTPEDIFRSQAFLIFLKGAVLLILIFYAIFALLIIRQVDLMIKTLITPVSPAVRALAILHAGVAIGFIILAWGVL